MNKDSEFREKGDSARRGRGFVGERGGNGTTTPEQERLAKATGYVMEYPVPTGNPSWKCALMDLAKPELKIAVEVDGKTHLYLQQQTRDRIKERMLARLGWLILRFTNEDINADLPLVVQAIQDVEKARTSPSIASSPTTSGSMTQPKKPVPGLARLAEDAKPSPLDNLSIEAQMTAAMILDRRSEPVPVEAKADISALVEQFAQADAEIGAAARAMADGVEPEPVTAKAVTAEPEPVAPARLKVHQPEPEDVVTADAIVFDEELIAKMFANLAAHGMTLQDLAG